MFILFNLFLGIGIFILYQIRGLRSTHAGQVCFGDLKQDKWPALKDYYMTYEGKYVDFVMKFEISFLAVIAFLMALKVYS